MRELQLWMFIAAADRHIYCLCLHVPPRAAHLHLGPELFGDHRNFWHCSETITAEDQDGRLMFKVEALALLSACFGGGSSCIFLRKGLTLSLHPMELLSQ